MSVVMAFVTREFTVMCADKRICRNGNIHSEDFRKVYYLNHNIIFGFAGSVLGNYILLSDYLEDFNYYSDDCFRVNFDKTKNISFEEVCNSISKKFDSFIEKYRGQEKIPEVSVMIGGFTEAGNILKTFYVRENIPGKDVIVGEENTIYHSIFGTKAQEKLLIDILGSMKEVGINGLQRTFQEVIDVDSKNNQNINAKMNAVFIEKPKNLSDTFEWVEVPAKTTGIYVGKTKKKIKKIIKMNDQDEFYA